MGQNVHFSAFWLPQVAFLVGGQGQRPPKSTKKVLSANPFKSLASPVIFVIAI
jgi:hypothetical protein